MNMTRIPMEVLICFTKDIPFLVPPGVDYLLRKRNDNVQTGTDRARGEEKKKRLHVLTALVLFFFF